RRFFGGFSRGFFRFGYGLCALVGQRLGGFRSLGSFGGLFGGLGSGGFFGFEALGFSLCLLGLGLLVRLFFGLHAFAHQLYVRFGCLIALAGPPSFESGVDFLFRLAPAHKVDAVHDALFLEDAAYGV